MFDITPTLQLANRSITLDRPRVMGIVNLTPDSFSDGGQLSSVEAALKRARRLLEEGADILDLGAESSRPGAESVSVDEELARLMPVLERVLAECDAPVSVDTAKPEVMRAAIAAGVHLINDIRALREPGAIDAVADSQVALCLMHMQGEPRSMQDAPQYDDVVADVHRFLAERIFACEMSGIDKRRIVVDPGFGFGKSLQHNYQLLARLARFADLKVPLLAGVSRKSMIGAVTGREVGDRLAGSVAAALVAAQHGAAIVRVHDVAATVDALKVWCEVKPYVQSAATKSAAPKIAWPDED
ncbi:dihydropteroate synthase [Pseudomarimonas arenosa]|uniref:Dihydropteroate synthase n=1 Tax=Pseudomarimonas arenosa TaxID=2774145 RepID=A0AAW3ZSL1_9GAMM|nr:dihydropteroate synthase [Pseudomarimonas arenosa]MBD8527519.1 dihydropteroate synthase [Pseudomarimonas arenosa]